MRASELQIKKEHHRYKLDHVDGSACVSYYHSLYLYTSCIVNR